MNEPIFRMYGDEVCYICKARNRNKGQTKAQFRLGGGDPSMEYQYVCHSHLNEALAIRARKLDEATVPVRVLKVYREQQEAAHHV